MGEMSGLINQADDQGGLLLTASFHCGFWSRQGEELNLGEV